MADNWRMSHDTVRLFVRDPKGRIVADSNPERRPVPPDATGLDTLIGTAPIPGGELVLSRPGQPLFPMHPEILIVLAASGIAIALFFLPLVRGLKSGLERMSGLAARVAKGQFGATIEPPRERELAELTLSLNEMSLQLRDQELRQHRLVADVSHELRSPMGRLRALAETVARQPAAARGYLLQIDEEIALMDRLVGDMLEMAQFDEGTVALKLETVSVCGWAADLFQRSRPHIEAAGIRFSSSLSEIDVEAHIDPQRLVQAVGNLIDNAIAAVQGCRSPRIALMVEVGLAEWSIIVTDNGRGIPEADLPYVFDRFFRVEKHRGRQGGAGLGLSIARAITEAHHGRIAIDSLVDQGTTVRLAIRRDDQST
jgi:signal transduction histidine kinase